MALRDPPQRGHRPRTSPQRPAVADEGRGFGWSVTGGNVHWVYTMDEADGGTELTESWEFTAKGQEFFAERFGDEAEAEIAKRTRTAHEGIATTLAAIKRIIERP